MANGVTMAKWLRFYSISDKAISILRSELGENLSVKISREFKFKIEDKDGNEVYRMIKAEGIDLLNKITNQQYLKDYLKMSDDDVEELISKMIKRVNPLISLDKMNNLKNEYLKEVRNVSDTFYLLDDGSGIIILVVPEKSVNTIIDKIDEKSKQTPSILELPDGPEFLLWLFYKYWKKSSIKGINITNVSSISNVEESNKREYVHRANGDGERDSLEICFKIILNKAITSLRLQQSLNNQFENEIEIQIPDRRKSPKSFRFTIPSKSVILPKEISSEISSLKYSEQQMLKKGLGAYIFYSFMFPNLRSEYKNEETSWKTQEKEAFVKEIYDYAIDFMGVHR